MPDSPGRTVVADDLPPIACPDALLGLVGLAVVIAAVVGLWRWAHRDDDVVWVDGGDVYYEEWEEWYEEER